MIKRPRRAFPVMIPRAQWVDVKLPALRCYRCLGKGYVWRDLKGHYSNIPYKCTLCCGRGIPPIPKSELE